MLRPWPVLLSLAFSLSQCATAQFLVYNGAQQIIFGAQGLQQALQDPNVTTITISGNVTLNAATWVTPPKLENRTLLFAGDGGAQVENVLNFNYVVGALILGDGAVVEFRNLTLSNPGPQNVSGLTVDYINYRSSSVGAWPSLIVLDGSEVFFNNSRLQYYSQITWSKCANFAAKVKYQLTEVLHYPNVSIVPNNNASLIITSLFNLTAEINNTDTGEVVGTVELSTLNTTMTCITDPFPQDGMLSGEAPGVALSASGSSDDNGFKWWYILIIVAGAVVLLSAVAGIAVALFLRRRGRKKLQDPELDPKGPAPGLMSTGSATPSEELRTRSQGLSSSNEAALAPSELEMLRLPAAPSKGNLEAMANGAHNSGSQYSIRDTEQLPSGGVGSSGGKGSDGLTKTGLPWSDVTALLRARSDFSDLEVGPLIGRGSFGRVYKGRWKGAFVAIKIVDHQEAASKVIAMREGTLSHSVQHPNVVTTYSVFLQKMNANETKDQEDWAGDRGQPDDAMEGIPERAEPSFTEDHEHFATCMVLEYADRGTLEKAIMSGRFHSKSTKEPDLKAIHKTLLDIAGGMDYLHSVGVLHGDLKGANVLLKSTATDPRGFTCKLADFGMARVLATDRTHVSTQTYGTVSYMPAELLKEGKLTRAVDSYSFAILMWELFSGGVLFSGLTIAQVFYKVCYEQEKPVIPDGMPEGYQELMVRCWDDDPMRRPSFSEIFESLSSMQPKRSGPLSSVLRPSSSGGSPPRRDSKNSVSFSPAPTPPAVNSPPEVDKPVPQASPGPNPFAAVAVEFTAKAESSTTAVDDSSAVDVANGDAPGQSSNC